MVSVTLEMCFYAADRRKCHGCGFQLDRYGHIQYECRKIQSKVEEEETVRIIRFRSNYFKEIRDSLMELSSYS